MAEQARQLTRRLTERCVAPHLRLASIPSTGHRMRVPHAFQQVALRPQTARGELAAPPLDLDRVLAQPGVTLRRPGDRLFQSSAGMCRRFIEGHAKASLGHQQVRH